MEKELRKRRKMGGEMGETERRNWRGNRWGRGKEIGGKIGGEGGRKPGGKRNRRVKGWRNRRIRGRAG